VRPLNIVAARITFDADETIECTEHRYSMYIVLGIQLYFLCSLDPDGGTGVISINIALKFCLDQATNFFICDFSKK
jgi:hypothetical protein